MHIWTHDELEQALNRASATGIWKREPKKAPETRLNIRISKRYHTILRRESELSGSSMQDYLMHIIRNRKWSKKNHKKVTEPRDR